MRNGAHIAVVIPALNEEGSIGHVLDAIPDWVDDIVVADNGSSDGTPNEAKSHGARVVHEARRGYGSACLAGIAALKDPEVVVFLDGDFSDHPDEMPSLVDPILAGEAEMVIGSRIRGEHERGALTPQARFGNWLACALMRLFWGQRYTDLGPFRAIRFSALKRLRMADPDYGWTVEMQIKAARQRVKAIEVPVSYRKRVGVSKISGTIRGVVGAGYKILSTIFLAALQPRHAPVPGRLVIFTRYPEPGQTKTRLIPALGPEGAATLQREMTEHAMRTAERFASEAGTEIEVRFAGGSDAEMQDWLGRDKACVVQGDGDLGARMQRTFQTAFRGGSERVVIIGIDCPGITEDVLEQAFREIHEKDIVFGPATDGGYYLIGMRGEAEQKAIPALFEDMPWGTGEVLAQSLSRAAKQALTIGKLQALDDVDRPEDLTVWESVSKARSGAPCA